MKNFGEKGWGLYDLQTSAVQMAIVDGKKMRLQLTDLVNAFTELLSKAADDSTLRQKVVLPVEEKKQEAVVAVAKTTNTTDAAVSAATSEKPVAKEPQTEILIPANSAAVGAARKSLKKEAATITDSAANKPQQVKARKEETRTVAAPALNAVNPPVTKEEPKILPDDKTIHTW